MAPGWIVALAERYERETIGRKRLRDGISPDKKVKIRRKETNDFECMKDAKKYLHRTQDPENPHKYKSIICVICDRFIIGTEKIDYLSKDNISAHSQRLSGVVHAQVDQKVTPLTSS